MGEIHEEIIEEIDSDEEGTMKVESLPDSLQ
jgi:hypothetical protein